MYSLDPRDHVWVDNDHIFEWRQYLKQELLQQRRYLSDYSGKYLTTCEMHEGLITRANVPKNVWWQIFIYHPYNCFLLLPEEHRLHGHEREWAVKKSYERYGRNAVVLWFESLPFKVRPFKLL
jgi:hypothetical protein